MVDRLNYRQLCSKIKKLIEDDPDDGNDGVYNLFFKQPYPAFTCIFRMGGNGELIESYLNNGDINWFEIMMQAVKFDDMETIFYITEWAGFAHVADNWSNPFEFQVFDELYDKLRYDIKNFKGYTNKKHLIDHAMKVIDYGRFHVHFEGSMLEQHYNEVKGDYTPEAIQTMISLLDEPSPAERRKHITEIVNKYISYNRSMPANRWIHDGGVTLPGIMDIVSKFLR